MVSGRIVEHRVLYKEERLHAAFPTAASMPNGEILVVFRRARDLRWLLPPEGGGELVEHLRDQVDHVDSRSHFVQLRFDSTFNPIAAPQSIVLHPEAADQDPSLILASDGGLLLFGSAWFPVPRAFCQAGELNCSRFPMDPDDHYLFWGSNLRRSSDAGRYWSSPEALPPLPGSGCGIPDRLLAGGCLRGAPVCDGDEVLVTTYCEMSEGVSSAHLWRCSSDGSRIDYGGRIAIDEDRKVHMQEPALYRSDSGRIIAFIRTRGLDDRLVTAESDDGGHSWHPWQVRNVIGHPFHPLRLRDGRVLLTYGYRHPPYGIRARLLDNECSDLEQAPEWVIRDDGGNGDIGYPWSVQLADNRVAIVYYYNEGGGLRYIAASIVELPDG